MTKEKSSSAKKLKQTETTTLNKVTSWTKNELSELQANSKLPVCIALPNGDYTVGTFKIEKISSTCWKVDNIEFTDKRGAIFFCVLLCLRKFADANELRDADWLLGRLDSDKITFRARLDNAHLQDDQFKIDLYSSRFDDAKQKLAAAKIEFEKIINKVKYILRWFIKSAEVCRKV